MIKHNIKVNSNKKINFEIKSRNINQSPRIKNDEFIMYKFEKAWSNSEESKKITESLTRKGSAGNCNNNYNLRKSLKLSGDTIINNIEKRIYTSRSEKIIMKLEAKEASDQYYCKDCLIL